MNRTEPALAPGHLRTLAEEAGRRFAAVETDLGPRALADLVLGWAAEKFDRIAVACSMADAVLPHLVAEHRPGVDVLFLDTGYHFPETLATRDRVADQLDVTVVDVLPGRTVAEQDADLGPRLHDRDPGRCCALRKVDPLRRTLAGYDAWVTGVRREEGPTRADTPLVTWDEAFGLVKINPLATWTLEQVLDHAEREMLPANPLLAQGYPSIGCAPCTRPVAPGEDPRAGRWAGFAKTECGLHPGAPAGGDGTAPAGARAIPPSSTTPTPREAP
ncbi:phosphoadenylyl-sulfate reductase [Ornithinimicrobium sp. CNJ-824]|uniref:phosphoadenylyl-sulfate reductase n=1 Tax=Ornithinimicrobium sp. CNJ-824 TaxID=1904966 RepID=UPI0009FA0F41|nr:phosphoadenylyl-sulfate reductase [Ornithinimicrobium sp. CNJ-824]